MLDVEIFATEFWRVEDAWLNTCKSEQGFGEEVGLRSKKPYNLMLGALIGLRIG